MPKTSDTAIKVAWIGVAGAVVAAVIGAAATLASGRESDSDKKATPTTAASTRQESGEPGRNVIHSLPSNSEPSKTAPIAKLAPDIGRGGTKTVFTAEGFEPGEQVDIIWRANAFNAVETLRTTQADDRGAVAVEVIIPRDPYLIDDGESVVVRGYGHASAVKADTVFIFQGPAR
ncbi:hypothetical protein [Microbispora sp. GKU 823]|uniref:hypothetical protein n=1 Tax=Microbispora sp. GKU 823 TaxID=1652100 RepID=UPI00117E7F29|nr:hypothetical protein [Microbispora sp. GKU 823]